MTTQEELIKKSQTTKSNYEQLFKSYTGTEVLNDLSKRFFVFTSTITILFLSLTAILSNGCEPLVTGS